MKLILELIQSFAGYFPIYLAVWSFRTNESRINTWKRYFAVFGLVALGGIILTL